VTATGSAVMADDPDQVIRRFLQEKKIFKIFFKETEVKEN
jgi:hypothetical protein